MDPTPERFQRLARSAPYRWRALVLEGSWAATVHPVRVTVQRPDRLRVERQDGTALFDGRQGSLSGGGGGGTLDADGTWHPYVVPPAPDATRDEDGLVTTDREPWREGPEVPFWQDYRFVAVLDPYELSDGVEVLDVRAVEHGGRPAWEARLRPTAAYEPRCTCCALLHSLECDLAEGFPPRPAYADAHLVRLDVGTGVCVRTRELGGPSDGQGHDLVVVHAEP